MKSRRLTAIPCNATVYMYRRSFSRAKGFNGTVGTTGRKGKDVVNVRFFCGREDTKKSAG